MVTTTIKLAPSFLSWPVSIFILIHILNIFYNYSNDYLNFKKNITPMLNLFDISLVYSIKKNIHF